MKFAGSSSASGLWVGSPVGSIEGAPDGVADGLNSSVGLSVGLGVGGGQNLCTLHVVAAQQYSFSGQAVCTPLLFIT